MSRGALSGLARGMGVLGLAVLAASGALAADITGRKGLGGSLGTSLVIGDWEYRQHARPRFTGDALFKYGFMPRWALVGSFGYGWNSYSDEESWLSSEDYSSLRESLGLGPDPVEKVTVIAPFTGGVEYRFGKDVWVPYVGAGAGIYQLNIYHDGRVAEDPRTLADHRTYNFGVYGRVGIEQFLSESVAMDYDLLGHILFSSDREKFPDPSGADFQTYGHDFKAYGGDTQFLQIRLGLRYYWGGSDKGGEAGEEGVAPSDTEVTPAEGAVPPASGPEVETEIKATPAAPPGETAPTEIKATPPPPPPPAGATEVPAETISPEQAAPPPPQATPPTEPPSGQSAPPDTSGTEIPKPGR
jgi:hypothetical protein